MPCVTDTAAPATNSPSAANSDHTYASRPWPSGCAGQAGGGTAGWRSAGRSRCRRPPTNAPPRPPVDADPVTTAATDFATATRTLAPKATSTVMTLSDPLASSAPGHGAEQIVGSVCGLLGHDGLPASPRHVPRASSASVSTHIDDSGDNGKTAHRPSPPSSAQGAVCAGVHDTGFAGVVGGHRPARRDDSEDRSDVHDAGVLAQNSNGAARRHISLTAMRSLG